MVIIERLVGESLRLGDGMRIKILSVTGDNRVRLGLEMEGERAIAAPAAPMAQPLDALGQVAENTLRALLVEDDPVHARLIQRAIGLDKNVETVLVPNGEAAIAYLSDTEANELRRADLVLLDLHLPGVSGFDVLRSLKADQKLRAIPVVVLSSSDDDRDISTCLGAGANAFVTKALDYGELCRSMLRITNFWRHTQRVIG
jgi:CheY-like chemotaxis protein